MSIFTSLKSWRKAEELTQRDAAIRLKITQPHYSRLERKISHTSPEGAIKMEKLTGIPRYYFRPDLWKPEVRGGNA